MLLCPALRCDDFHPSPVLHRQYTGRHRLAIPQDLASPALLRTVAVFDAFQTQVVPQDVEQRGFGGDLEMEDLSVDVEGDLWGHGDSFIRTGTCPEFIEGSTRIFAGFF